MHAMWNNFIAWCIEHGMEAVAAACAAATFGLVLKDRYRRRPPLTEAQLWHQGIDATTGAEVLDLLITRPSVGDIVVASITAPRGYEFGRAGREDADDGDLRQTPPMEWARTLKLDVTVVAGHSSPRFAISLQMRPARKSSSAPMKAIWLRMELISDQTCTSATPIAIRSPN